MTDGSTPVAQPTSSFPWGSLVVLAASVLAFAALLVLSERYPEVENLTKRVELAHWNIDWRTAYLSDRAPTQHSRVAIIALDRAAADALNQRWSPIDRVFLAGLVGEIDKTSPAAIGLAFRFEVERANDAKLQQAIRDAKAPVVIGAGDPRLENDDPAHYEPRLAFQASFMTAAGKPAGHLLVDQQVDDVIRRKWDPGLGAPYRDSFSLLLAKAVNATVSGPSRYIAWLAEPADKQPTFLRYSANELVAPSDAAKLADLRKHLKDRMVLVGVDDAEYRFRTPLYAQSHQLVSGVEMQAQLVAELLDGRHIWELTPNQQRAVLGILAAVGLISIWSIRASTFGLFGWRLAKTRVSWPALSVIFMAVDALIFATMRTILAVTLCVAALYLGTKAGDSSRNLLRWARGK